jgi:mono/diheme cytochrome c family protein
MKKRVLALALAAGIPALELATAARRPPPWEKNRLQIGQSLYRENCVVCHDIETQQSKKYGPSFYQLFRRDKMPLTNVKPNREYIKVRVKFGGSLMPAFRRTLTDLDIDTVIDYIASK